METEMDRAGVQHRIVIAGAGYAGLHVALRLGARLERRQAAQLTLVDQHDYHQVLTELPRVAAGTRQADAVRVPVQQVLEQRVTFVQTRVTGFDLAEQRLLTESTALPYTRLVLALGSRPNDFAIPGLAERALSLYSVADAERVWTAVNEAVRAAAGEGFKLKDGEVIEGGVFVWAGGVKAPELVHGSALPIGYNGRIKVDQYLRALDHPEIFVAGDLASVVDPQTGHALPPLAQIALEEGETVVHNLEAEL